jgi:TrmH family RNA methyltransferase
VQRLRQLANRRSARWEAGRFVAEGPNLLEEALGAGAPIEAVYLDVMVADDRHRSLAEQAADSGAAVFEVAAGVLERVSDVVTPQPVTAVVGMVDVALDSLPLDGLTVVGVGWQDPGNAGTVIRSATASGSGAVIFCAGAVDMYNPKTVRASAGAIFHIPLVSAGTPDSVLGYLGRRGVPRVAAAVRAGRPYDEMGWTGSTALVLGAEAHGLPAELAPGIDACTTIPMHPGAESLNLAMAATVICFEAARQRRAAAEGAE